MTPDLPMKSTINEYLTAAENGLVNVAVVLAFMMSTLITASVIARYVFNRPFSGVPTVVTVYFMIGIIFLTSSYLQREEGNVNVDLFYTNFSPRTQTVIDLLQRVVMVGIFTWVAYLAFLQTYSRWEAGAAIHGAYTFPTAYSWGMIPLGISLLIFRLMLQIHGDVHTLLGRDDE